MNENNPHLVLISSFPFSSSVNWKNNEFTERQRAKGKQEIFCEQRSSCQLWVGLWKLCKNMGVLNPFANGSEQFKITWNRANNSESFIYTWSASCYLNVHNTPHFPSQQTWVCLLEKKHQKIDRFKSKYKIKA